MPTYLTTPIAYITTIFEDPFVSPQSQSTYNSATYPLATRVGMRYVYYNPPANIEANSNTDVVEQARRMGWAVVALWLRARQNSVARSCCDARAV